MFIYIFTLDWLSNPLQIAKFLGGESNHLFLEKDESGAFITTLDVGLIKADGGNTYGCQPSPGVDAEVKVHVIREGTKESF